MGKAIVISIAIVLIILMMVLLIMWLNRRDPVGDMSRKQEHEALKLINQAAGVMRALGIAHNNLDDMDYLSDRSRDNVARWLEQYDNFKLTKRDINA